MKTTKLQRSKRGLRVGIAALVILLTALSGAQIPPQEAVEGILSRFPAERGIQRDALCAELLQFGEEGVLAVCSRVFPPEGADDTEARFALGGLTDYVMRPGADKERRWYTRALTVALKKRSEREARAFILSQLQKTGDENTIKAIRVYLADLDLFGPASRAIQAIGTDEAEKAFLKALDDVEIQRPALLKILGEMRGRRSGKKIMPFASHPDARTRRAARFALANIGHEAAEPILASVGVTGGQEERAEAVNHYLLFARRVAEKGDADLAADICTRILAAYTAPQEQHIPCRALSLLAELKGPDILADLIDASQSPNAELRGQAMELAASLPGKEVTQVWLARLASSTPVVRAEILAMLGRRGDRDALPAILSALEGPATEMQLSAIPAAVALGGTQVLPDLWSLLDRTGTDPDEDPDLTERKLKQLTAAFLRFSKRDIVTEAAGRLASAPPAVQAELIVVLAEKEASEHADLIFDLAEGDDGPVRSAALDALPRLSRAGDVSRLAGILSRAGSSQEVILLQDAIEAACLKVNDPEKRSDGLIQVLSGYSGKAQADILRIFSRIGGKRALKVVEDTAAGRDNRLKAAAVSTLAQWPTPDASKSLLDICLNTGERKYLIPALRGYLRLVSQMPVAPSLQSTRVTPVLDLDLGLGEKRILISGLGRIRCADSVHRLALFLGQPEIEGQAARAIIELCLPEIGGPDGLTDLAIIPALKRAAGISGDLYLQDRVKKHVERLFEIHGYRPLFNGRNLAGWKGGLGDPIKRRGMTASEQTALQRTADESMRHHWRAQDGELVFDGRGENLSTDRDFGDFELWVDWKIGPGGDSGIYLRGTPQVQIWDPAAGPGGSGGLYNNVIGSSQPLLAADRPVGEWNTFRIVMIGERVTVDLNGLRAVDSVAMENAWERGGPISARGPIELQSHNTPLAFRDIYIREITGAAGVLSVRVHELAEGFRPLFNGQDLSGWTGDTEGHVVEDGKIIVVPERARGNLYTREEYGDFILRFEFKLSPGANNGLGVRTPLEGDAAYVGLELQILDNSADRYRKLEPYQYHGSIYGIVPAERGYLRPVGEWNEQEVLARGRRIRVRLNGVVIVDADMDQAVLGGTADGREHPGLKRQAGHIGFLGHGSRVEFRNLRIKDLSGNQ